VSLKSTIKYLGKLLLSGAVFVIAMQFGGLLATLLGFQQPVMPEGTTGWNSILYLALESPLFAFALSLLAVGISGRLMARALMLSLFGWCVYSLNTVIESIAFLNMSPSGATFTAITFLLPCLACGAVTARLFPPVEPNIGWMTAARKFFIQRSVYSWCWCFITAALVFVPIYLLFGSLVVPFTGEYFRHQMYGLTMPSQTEILKVLTIRSVLFLLACLPIIIAWQKSKWNLVLSLGFGLFVLVGFLYMLGATYMPLAVRIPHTLEILADSFTHAGLLVLLLAKRSAT
jgi:hypothetical protein